MNSPDLKKLITGFLVLSVVTSSGVFFFSGFKGTLSSPSDLEGEIDAKNLIAAVPKNALVEPIPKNLLPLPTFEAETGEVARAADPSNLTDVFAENLAEKIVLKNPEGPQDLGGETAILPPNPSDLNKVLNENIAKIKFDFANTRINETELKILKNYTEKDLAAYISAFNRVSEETLGSEEFENLTEADPSFASLSATELLLAQTFQKSKPIPVPEELKNFHKNYLVLVSNSQKILDTIGDYEKDPLKTLAVAQSAEAVLARDLNNFEQEAKKFEKLARGLHIKTDAPSLVQKIFGIKIASAQVNVPVDSPPTSPFTFMDRLNKWLRILFEWARLIGTELLKNQLVHRLTQQILTWVQGGGKPQFITNWRGFLSDAASQAAGYATQKIFPKLCQSFGAVVALSLRPVPSLETPVDCTLDDIGVNVAKFNKDFRDGGWVAYGASAQQNNNVFGAYYGAQILINNEALKSKDAKKSQGESDSGFKPKLGVCQDKYTISGRKDLFKDDPNYIGASGCNAGGFCNTITMCHPDGWQAGTPGQFVAEATTKNIGGAPLEKIVNSRDITDLISGLVDSFLNKMTEKAFNLITPTTITNTKPPASAACSGLTGQALNDCLGAVSDIPTEAPPELVPPPPPPPTTSCPSTNTLAITGQPVCSEFTAATTPTFSECLALCSGVGP